MWCLLAAAAGSGGLNLWSIVGNAHPLSKVVFAILVFCSILSIAIIIERYLVLAHVRRTTLQAQDLLERWAATREWGLARQRIIQATRETMPLFSMLRAGIVYWQELVALGDMPAQVKDTLIRQAVVREQKLVRVMLRANLPILANVASTAPFIGLFGTVVGIVLTFDIIARTGAMGQNLVASGIADALVATAMGLFAAIPAVIAYNVFTSKIAALLLQMEETALERIYFLVEHEDAKAPAAAKGVGSHA